MSVRHSKDESLVVAYEVDDAQPELAKNGSAAAGEARRPALRRLCNCRYRCLKFRLKIYGLGKTFFRHTRPATTDTFGLPLVGSEPAYRPFSKALPLLRNSSHELVST